MVEDGICPICKYPKKSASSGRLTQWIIACNCDALVSEDTTQGVSVKICRECGKRIGEGRAGSFTQFVFRFDICQCQEPKPVSTRLDSAVTAIDDYYVDDQAEEELAVEAGTFPQERYKALSMLGSGTGGSVFLARDRLLDKLVAVKVLHWLEPKQIAAFQEEARVTNKVSHPSIVSLLDFGVTGLGVPYMVLEHIPGVSLDEFVIKNGPMSWPTDRQVFVQICDALEHAHSHGVLHRDIKPGNIILELNDDGSFSARLIDFGIAAMQNEGQTTEKNSLMAGAPLFMSPDVGLGRSYDVRSETYSLGCSFFFALTGQPPYHGETALQTIMLHAEQPPPKLSEFIETDEDFAPELDELVTKALAKDPGARFQSVSEFRQVLMSIEVPEVQVPIDDHQPDQIDASKKRQLGKFVVAGALILLTGVAIVLTNNVLQRSPVKTSEAPAIDKRVAEAKYVVNKIERAADSIQPQKWYLSSFGQDAIDVFGTRPKSQSKNPMYKYVYRGGEVTDEDFKDLVNKRPITGVNISPVSSSTGAGFRYLTNVPLQVVDTMSPGFNDEGALQLSKIKTINRLCIHRTSKLSEKGLAYIAEMPDVRTLQLRNIDNLPPNTIRILSRAKSLWQLDLGYSKPITPVDLGYLSSMPKLHSLALSETEIGDEHIAMICKRGIHSLELDKTKMSPKGLAMLSQCKGLKHLKISPGNGITVAAINNFKKLHPECTVKIVDPIDLIDVVKDL